MSNAIMNFIRQKIFRPAQRLSVRMSFPARRLVGIKMDSCSWGLTGATEKMNTPQ